VLLSVASYLFGFTDPKYTLSLMLLLAGAWTCVSGIFIVDRRDRTFYSAWGVVVAVLSSFAFLPANYTLGLVLVAVVALIIITAYGWQGRKMYTATTNTPTPASDTPAAT